MKRIELGLNGKQLDLLPKYQFFVYREIVIYRNIYRDGNKPSVKFKGNLNDVTRLLRLIKYEMGFIYDKI